MSYGAPSFDLPIGSLFADRYKIQGLLGRGGMGAVYRAADLFLAEDVALKVLPFNAEHNPALALRFRQEVKLSRRVSHPHVIRVHDIGEQGGLLYMTMELIAGPTLREVMRKERQIEPSRAIEIVRAIAMALGAAHAAEIIHRDLKPTNVLIDPAGRVVLTDFGIARCVDDDLGLTHGAIGTVNYMAPEQATNGRIDARTDLYALGVVLYEMLVGERPAGTAAEVTERIERERGRIPPALATLALRCLSLDPAARPESAAAFIAALDAISRPDVDEATVARSAASVERTLPLVPVAPVENTPQKLAVLPFRYRGPADQEYLADVLTDELVDAISRIQGLYVFGSGATERFKTSRDPITVGKELSACAVIDGTVQAAGNRVRVSVRLLQATTGVQRWVQQHDGAISDMFAFQEAVVRRVAEELRVELFTMAHSISAPTEAVDRYLEARREMRIMEAVSIARAIELLDQSIEISPGFVPAIAAHAVACTRAWFLSVRNNEERWDQRAKASVARAVAMAPHVAETHWADGMLAANRGDYQVAIGTLRRGLEIAPGCAPIHDYIGMLQSEAGHVQKALGHLELATELDPSRAPPWANLARLNSLIGERQKALEVFEKLEALERSDRFRPSLFLRIRDALWHKDEPAQRAVLPKIEWAAKNTSSPLMRFYWNAFQGRTDDVERLSTYSRELSVTESPRFRMATAQWSAEILVVIGRLDLALDLICWAAETVLVDVLWLEKCPLFIPLHDDPRFVVAQRLTRERASPITAF